MKKKKQTLKALAPMRIAEGEEVEFELQEFPAKRIRVKLLDGGPAGKVIEISGYDGSIVIEPRYANVVRIGAGDR